jgi:hypothetical protein
MIRNLSLHFAFNLRLYRLMLHRSSGFVSR